MYLIKGACEWFAYSTPKEVRMNSFDRQFQQRLELIFKKAEYDKMQEIRRQRQQEEAAKKCGNDNASAPTTKKAGTKKPGLG